MSLLAKEDVDCMKINWKGDLEYRLSPPDKKNVNIKKEQYFALMDYRSGYLAKAFIKAKIENQKATIGTLAKSREDNEFLLHQRDLIKYYSSKMDSIESKPSDMIRGRILGIEGQASIEYWKAIKSIIPEKFYFKLRTGRNASDPVNSMLNYGYSILQGEIWKSLHLAALDPYCGFLHSQHYGRTSLVFDLIEEFRQQIVDKSVLSILNKNQVNVDDFELKENFVIIKENSRKKLISTILNKLSNEINFNNKNMSYSNIILFQARQIAKFLEQKENYVGFYLRW